MHKFLQFSKCFSLIAAFPYITFFHWGFQKQYKRWWSYPTMKMTYKNFLTIWGHHSLDSQDKERWRISNFKSYLDNWSIIWFRIFFRQTLQLLQSWASPFGKGDKYWNGLTTDCGVQVTDRVKWAESPNSTDCGKGLVDVVSVVVRTSICSSSAFSSAQNPVIQNTLKTKSNVYALII